MIYESGNAIWTAEADGSGKRSLDHIPSANRFFARAFPSFSPNGEFIVYFQQAVGPMGDYWVIPATGGSPHQLTHDLQWGGKPAWTPDGHNVIFPSKRGGTITLWRVGMDGKNPEPVTTGLGQDAQPDVSADGQRLIYTSTRVEYFFMVTDPKTGKEEVLYRNRRAFYFPRVAPDGRSIAFFAEVEPREQIMLMHSDGHSLRQLTHYKSHEANIMPRWWPDGQSIIYYQNLRPASLRRLPLDGGPSETLLMEFDWELNMDAEPSPSGDRLAFVRTDPLTRERRVIIRRIETGDETQLDPAITHAPSWSADGSLLLGTGNDKVVVCPVTGSECRVVVDASNEAQSGLGFGNGKYGREARWSSDQSHIFYSRDTDEPGYFSLWRVKFDGSGDQQLFDFGPVHPLAHRFEVLPDDQILWGRYERSDSELVLAWISQNPSEP